MVRPQPAANRRDDLHRGRERRQPDGRLVEFIEIEDHPFWVATQAHPEFKSRPTAPAPLFRDFVGAACDLAESRNPHLIDLEPDDVRMVGETSGSAADR